MNVFSSLQTLAEKYKAAEDDSRDSPLSGELYEKYLFAQAEFRGALDGAWPLLEAAVKALEGASAALDATESALGACVERGDCSHLVLQTMVWKERDKARAALFSLTGEPR